MVIDRRDTGGSRDRGQLVLIGAITLAFILLGIVVVFNGVQYTETINTGDAGQSAEDVRLTESELVGIVYEVEENGLDEDELETVFGYYANSTAEQRPVAVSVTYGGSVASGDLTVRFSYTSDAVSIERELEVNE